MKLVSMARRPTGKDDPRYISTKAERQEAVTEVTDVVTELPLPRPYVILARPEMVSDEVLIDMVGQARFLWNHANGIGQFSQSPKVIPWKRRRGALFIYFYMLEPQYRYRFGVPLGRLEVNPLKALLTAPSPIVGATIAYPHDVARTSPLGADGEMTAEGFNSLSDSEFVMPYANELCFSKTMTQGQVGMIYENYDSRFARPTKPLHQTFADAYLARLRKVRQIVSGTPFDRWAAAWRDKEVTERTRIQTHGR